MFVFIAALSDKFNFACRSASMLVCLVVDSGYIHTALYLLCLLLLGFCIDSHYVCLTCPSETLQSFGVIALQFEIPAEKVEEIKPNRPSKPPPPPEVKPTTGSDSAAGSREDAPCTSA